MKNKIIFIFLAVLTLSSVILLNKEISNIPPLGKFLNPYNGFWTNSEINQKKVFEKINLNNLKDSLTVQFDSMLIPHVYAKNDEDLFYTQGYITALHRLWQMEFQIKAAAGELSEIIGKRALKRDREQRRKGITYAAKRTLNKSVSDTKTYKLLSSYVDGINDYIENLNYENYPVEYKLLNYKPEKWTLLKTFILMESMSDMLSSRDMDMEDSYLLNILGEEKYNLLFPEYHDKIKPIIPQGTKFNFNVPKIDPPKEKYFSFPLSSTISKPNKDNGSNNFAISSNKSKDGSAFLASQPDLSLNLPSIWYIIHLNSPNYNTMGASLPGAPGVIIGFNENVAWGETNATRDVIDWYKIEFKDNSRAEYRYGDKWLKTEKVLEEIKIKGEKTFIDTIVYTHYGPIVYDKNFNSNEEKENFAMRWIAHDESVEYKTFLLLNKAKNIYDIENALQYFHGPAQNFAYATKQGDIGLTIAGKFPIKWEGQGKFILDGSNPEHEWSGYIPYEHSLSLRNPESGYVSSANQHPVDKTYPYYYYSHNYEMYRGRRLNERLQSLDYISFEDIKKIQNDNFSYKAFEALPIILPMIDTVKLNEDEKIYYKSLSNWDYFANPNLSDPSLFVTWWENIRKSLWDEFDTMHYSYRKPNSFVTTQIIKENNNFDFYDNISTPSKENIEDIINESFSEAVKSLNSWKEKHIKKDVLWKNFKNTSVNHLLNIKSFSKDNIEVGGYRNILNAASERHGPSWRMIVRLNKSEKTQAWGVYPGGQSGNPGNINYFGEIENWGKGNYKKLLFNKSFKENKGRIIFEKTYYKQ